MPINKQEINEFSYQTLVDEIKDIIQQLEQDNIPLESALKLFEAGMQKTKQADNFINDIKSRVIKLVEENKVKDFSTE
ncbi:exodeoxyribonuclease VII small subunit [Spiroplasma endosymbiont of Amphibalanus improvisus]|uniref:exodeoxyribonuclease VII small subunit n=1 Tax=Spiroplasma endosymbiont of Amphibalanus improvisus TaxID=3066327 RepID=UPI00313EC350